MRRLRNLALFAVVVAVVLLGAGLLLRGPALRALGINPDLGPGGRARLTVPDGYSASVFAEGLAGPRFMAVSPDGVLFVAERGADRVVALPDTDGDGVADEIIEVGAEYDRAHDIEFDADGTLLVAGESLIHRITLDGSGLREERRATVVDGLPSGGRHAAKTVEVLPDGNLLVSMGSSCDVCIEADPRRGAMSLIDPRTGDQRIYMTGLRNAVGLWVDDETGRAWATVMGRDLIGDDRPPETLYEVTHGADGGWPRCHAGSIADPEFGREPDACAGVAQPAATFQAHSAPLALVGWRDHLVIAFHGSWNRSTKVGYKVVWLPWDGEPAGEASDLATGFLPDGADSALGRPAGLAVGGDGALYVSDDKAGFIYRIAPQEIARRGEVEDCGAERSEHGANLNAEGRRCLMDAFQAGRPAIFISQVVTVEGAPVRITYRALGLDVVKVEHDFRFDPLSSRQIEVQRCSMLVPVAEWNLMHGAQLPPEYVFVEDGCVRQGQ